VQQRDKQDGKAQYILVHKIKKSDQDTCNYN